MLQGVVESGKEFFAVYVNRRQQCINSGKILLTDTVYGGLIELTNKAAARDCQCAQYKQQEKCFLLFEEFPCVGVSE